METNVISGYEPQKLTEAMLIKWRTGKHAANPAGAFLLVQMIDQLRSEVVALKANDTVNLRARLKESENERTALTGVLARMRDNLIDEATDASELKKSILAMATSLNLAAPPECNNDYQYYCDEAVKRGQSWGFRLRRWVSSFRGKN